MTETFSIEQIQSLNKGDLVKSIMNKYDIKEAAVVGDRLSDINAAKDNGLLAIGCNFDFAQEDELAQADIVIDDLMELKGILSEVKNTHAMNYIVTTIKMLRINDSRAFLCVFILRGMDLKDIHIQK